MRIRVRTQQLLDLSSRLQEASHQLQDLAHRAGSAPGTLDWQVRQQVSIDERARAARQQGMDLANRATDMARFLAAKAHAFAEADGRQAAAVSRIGAEYQQSWQQNMGHLSAQLGFPAQRANALLYLGSFGKTALGIQSIPLPSLGQVVLAIISPLTGFGVSSDLTKQAWAPVSQRAQVQEAIENLKAIDGLKPDQWKKLNLEQRMQVLQQVEGALAQAQGRPPLRVVPSTELDKDTFAEYRGTEIHVNQSRIRDGGLHWTMQSLAHETRHAYQHHVFAAGNSVESPELVQAWEDNLTKNYLHWSKVGWRRYRRQPVEADAFAFGDLFADKLVPQNVVKEAVEDGFDGLGIPVKI